VPHILDQFYWSRTIWGLHLGPEGISIKNLDKKAFESRLLDLMNNPSYKNNAAIISEKLKTENDITRLYDMIIN
jgi:hypothetical protein